MSLGARIRLEREQRGWTQVNLAEEAGITQASVSWYERGIQKPEQGTLRRLSEALDVPVETLLLESIDEKEVLEAREVLQKAIRDIESLRAGSLEESHAALTSVVEGLTALSERLVLEVATRRRRE